jgi:hypothetical protein
MISRRSTLRIEHPYEVLFTEWAEWISASFFDFQKLWEYLYEEEVEGWFLEQIKSIEHARQFRDVVLGLHTDTTLNAKSLHPEVRQKIAQKILRQLADAVLKFCGPDLDSPIVKETDELILTRGLVRQLEIDGYVYRNNRLYQAESAVIPEEAEQSYLESLIVQTQFADPDPIIHHLKLSEEHFLSAKWDDSISNSRKVLDAILKQITERVYIAVEKKPAPIGLLKNAQQTREYLETQGLVTTVERETLDKTYGLLSVTGGHPYIAEKDQARLMRHLALTFSQFVLLRYQGFLSNNP